ncbi:MAG: SpoVR family protein [Blastocatellia bacterium]|nr:SpoVR family protein [Blastocatellia bacterium]
MDAEVKELEKALERVWEIAIKNGLDPFPVKFEIVPATVMYEIGSYALPGRYSHWTFGKAYHRMKTMYDFGLSKIYEVVINTNPSYAFLLETNSTLQNTMVMAHVLGHVDFFKNNVYFSKTNRRMVDEVSLHAQRISEYEFKYGRKVVEEFLDAVLSIEEHVDPDFFIKKKHEQKEKEKGKAGVAKEGLYADLFALDEKIAARKLEQNKKEQKKDTKDLKSKKERTRNVNPLLPEKDLVYFIMQNSPILEPWQRDIMAMIHEEMLYFVPQMQTKIMNEGWASYWHARIMREMDLDLKQHIEFSNLHSSVVSPHRNQLNPYYLGYKIFEDIEKRWNNPTEEEKRVYGRKGSEGRAKIFEVRELDNDISFLRNYLTEELCEELDLFVFELSNDEEWKVTEKRWERVRDTLVSGMTNFGFPYIEVADDDYDGNRELYLKHRYEGVELDSKYARKVLEYVHKLWGRVVHLETTVDNETSVLHFDGEEHSDSSLH